MIVKFRGQYGFLSNMHSAPVVLDGLIYPSVEHAYQAAKTFNETERKIIRENPDPVFAKRMGYKVQKRPDWEDVRLGIMNDLLQQKFQKPSLAQKLLKTNPQHIKEGNTWHDNYWGSCSCPKCQDKGKNNLGKLLMQTRNSLCSVQLWTAQYNYPGEDRHDITVKSGDLVFAPNWQLVTAYKNNQITWEEYTQQYLELMRQSYQTQKQHWLNLLQKPSITLVCFCSDHTHCHRKLLAEILIKVGQVHNIHIAYHGERESKTNSDREIFLPSLF